MPGSTVEERIAGLEGSYQELTKRIDDFRSETHRNFDSLTAESRANFRWKMSPILINWLTLTIGILLIFVRK